MTENNIVKNEIEYTDANLDAHEEVSHEVTLYAEPVAHFGHFTITNSLITTWVVVFVVLIISLAIKLKSKLVPRGFQNFFEFIIEGAMDLADQVTGDKKITAKVF